MTQKYFSIKCTNCDYLTKKRTHNFLQVRQSFYL